VICGFILLIAVIYVIRLYGLQISDDRYKASADSNAYFHKTVYPARGAIYDRNGTLIVENKPAYDVMIIPREVTGFDTIGFCNTFGITVDKLRERIRDMKASPGYSRYTPQVLISNVSDRDIHAFDETFRCFYSGFFIQQRILRSYNTHSGGNILGNIREVSGADIERDPYFAPGDYCGDLGVEKSYDTYLRGIKGSEIYIRDASGRLQGRYDNGSHDIPAIAGRNIKLSIDWDLQQYAESLMVNKIGAVVAIEPATGEILCMVSSPTYDPNLLVGRQRGKNYSELVNNPYKPLFDRALMAAYPPGSTFKPTQGLILLQEDIVTLGTAYPCYHGYVNGRLRLGCHSHASPIALRPALQTSCNAYFCWGFKSLVDRRSKYGSTAEAFEVWKKHLVSMGYGYKLGVDLPGEYRGFLPNAEYYNQVYGDGHWRANTVISVSIGQGEIMATPLQIANLCATVANRGWFITPHIVKEIQDTVLPSEYTTRRRPTIDTRHYAPIAEGMRMAVTGGTCRLANLPDIMVAGKTGTAQNPHGKDHSAFIGFAPYEQPRIAVCAYIENAGYGATFGVPIGSLVIEKYLKGEISPERKYIEQRMLESNTIIYSGVKKH